MENTISGSRLVCVTPTKNESWIVEPFVRAASLWADDIIVADQASTDGTREFLKSAPKVTFVANDLPAFDECHRQKLLLENARRLPGKRVLIGLDADEALSANWAQSSARERIRDAAPGTILRFKWVNVLPGFKKAWIPPGGVTLGFVDDGSPHDGRIVHSPRVPNPRNAPILDLEDVVVLHFQYVIWERMLAKQRWYQVWEFLKHQKKGPLAIFREYNHMLGSWNKDEIHPLKPEWIDGFGAAGVGFDKVKMEPVTWWERDLLKIFREHGTKKFRKLAIWECNWTEIARRAGDPPGDYADPRTWFEKLAHRMLGVTQCRRGSVLARLIEKGLRLRGW